MTHPANRRPAELFKEALDLHGDALADFLDLNCEGDAPLRSEVESLLEADRNAAAFMSAPPAAVLALAGAEPDGLVGQIIGGYRIVRRVASGGMGTVYEAVQERLGRTAALKVIRGGLASASALRRFEYEAKLLAHLRHPAIAQIYEVGTHTIAGVSLPFFAMEYVPNALSIVDFVRQNKLTVQQRLELFARACDAVQYAHQRGVIHRDLKPSNVLVGDDATSPAGPASHVVPKVIDFGVARLIDSDTAMTSLHTGYGQLVGTLQYMSPEQCGADPQDIDARSDIYSLGVMLYELLAGRPPYVVQSLSLLDATLTIREQSPPRLSGIDRALRGDLETIARKALEKDRDRRYQSAGELADEIRRYLSDKPIAAKRDSGWYVLRKMLRRYRRAVLVAASFVALLTTAAVALSILYARQGRLLVEVEDQRDKAEQEAYAANIAAADASITANDGGAAIARLSAVPARLRNWEWHYLARQADQSVATWYGPPDFITNRVRISPSGKYVAALFWLPPHDQERRVQIWERASGEPVAHFNCGPNLPMTFEFLAQDDQILIYKGDGCFVRFDVADRREVERYPVIHLQPTAAYMDLSPDGRVLVYGRGEIWNAQDVKTGKLLSEYAVPKGRWINVFATSATAMALGMDDGLVSLKSMNRPEELARIQAHAGIVHGLAFSHDERLLATSGGESGELKLWELTPRGPTGDAGPLSFRMAADLHGGGQRKAGISFSPDDKAVAAASEDKAIRVWNVADGHERATLLGHSTGITCVDYSADGRFLLSGARGGVVKLWDLQRSPAVRSYSDFLSFVRSIKFSTDQKQLLVIENLTALMVGIADGQRSDRLHLPHDHLMPHALPGPGDEQFTMSVQDGNIKIYDLNSHQAPQTIGQHASVAHIAGDASRRILLSAEAQTIVVRDWLTGREFYRFAGPGEAVQSLALSADASHLALGLESGEIVIGDAQSGRLIRGGSERKHSQGIASVVFSPDGKRLASGSVDGVVNMWDAANGRKVWAASPQLGEIWCMDFSPDGSRLAVGGRDRSVRLFDTGSGREMLALRGPTGTVLCLTFSPDGTQIAAGSWAGEVFIWSAARSAAGG